MAHNIFRGAANQDVLESGYSVGGCDDHVRMVFDGPRANSLTGMSDLEGRFYFDSIPIRFFDQIAHLKPRRPFGLLHPHRKVVARAFVTRDEVLKSNRIKQNK